MCGGDDRRDEKGESTISHKIKVGVIIICTKECVLNSAGELLRHNVLVSSVNQFRFLGIKPSNMKDVVFFKVAGNKGGGAFKLPIDTLHVEHPQSLRHVQPGCEFTSPDT